MGNTLRYFRGAIIDWKSYFLSLPEVYVLVAAI
jgi:hypothetical protein